MALLSFSEVLNFCCGCQAKPRPDIESKNCRCKISHSDERKVSKIMESQLNEKRSRTLKFITLGTLVALSSTLTGCSTSPTAIAQKDKDKDKDKEENRTSGGHYYGGHGVATRFPSGGASNPKPSGTIQRGWFGGFRFSGG